MKEAHYKRETCRLCDSRNVVLRIPFGSSPIGGAFVTAERKDIPQDSYPLDLYQCTDCEHVQMLDVVNPELVFADYTYFSGRTGLMTHFAKYAESVIEDAGLKAGDFVVDIGSNDGGFLSFFKERGMRVLGVDPATNVAAAAEEAGIPTLPLMFDSATAERIRNDHGPAKVITANNVFAHVDDLTGMLTDVRALLADDGLFYFEVSYVVDVIDKMLLGTVFHEHLSHHSVKPLVAFLERGGMQLVDVKRVAIQGGSLICTAQRAGGKRPVASSVASLVDLETARGVGSDGFFEPFRSRLAAAKADMSSLLDGIADRGERVAAYGAARGGTFITYLFDLGRHIKFIVDDDPHKINSFSPGWHIPVVPVSALYEESPDYVVILAWVHSDAIVQKNQRYLESGGRFITFFPSIKVVDRNTAS